MMIEVTQSHIERGQRMSASHCPLALAIQEQRPNTHTVYVASGYTDVFESEEVGPYFVPTAQYKTTQKMEKFICDFDTGHEVSPMSFRLMELPFSVKEREC